MINRIIRIETNKNKNKLLIEYYKWIVEYYKLIVNKNQNKWLIE